MRCGVPRKAVMGGMEGKGWKWAWVGGHWDASADGSWIDADWWDKRGLGGSVIQRGGRRKSANGGRMRANVGKRGQEWLTI